LVSGIRDKRMMSELLKLKLEELTFDIAVAKCIAIEQSYKDAGLEIATHWSPMRPKIECWRVDFQNWSPAGDSRFLHKLFAALA